MWKHFACSCAVIGSLMGPAAAQTPDAMKAAAATLGADAVDTLQFTASGTTFTVGQNFTPTDPWPRVPVKSYRASIDYRTGGMRVEMVREVAARMPRGGGVPFAGELPQIQVIGGDYAWNEPVATTHSGGPGPATPCTRPEAGSTAWAGPGGKPGPQPAHDNHAVCMLALWSTPQGFVKAAEANHATIRKVADGSEVSFVLGGRHRMVGLVDARHQLAWVKTWADQSLVGDMPIETSYSDYRSFGAVQFPTRIVQKQDGFPSLELTVTSVTANAPLNIAVPAKVRAASAPPVMVEVRKLAQEVFVLAGGTHHSMAIGMKDHIVLVDTPNGEARALAVIVKAKELMPGKPIRYVVAMHHHWDHLGGIRAAIDEGATIVTHQINRDFIERVASAPHTIHPDRLSVSKRPLKLMTVDAEGSLSDGARTIRFYTMTDFDHSADMLMVHLPKERILAAADAYAPVPPNTPLTETQLASVAALYDNIRRRQLDVRTFVSFHGGTTDLADLAQQAARARGVAQ
jgi:glyoxylase-like metal-dependent hydrolase (beta-lactamase superfamily II)